MTLNQRAQSSSLCTPTNKSRTYTTHKSFYFYFNTTNSHFSLNHLTNTHIFYNYENTQKLTINSKEIKMSIYYYNLNFLKIIFLVVVILYHFIRKMGFWCQGGYAVELFFIISGFLCAVTFNKNLSIPDFLKKKTCSFIPFLIFAILTLLPFRTYNITNILNNILLIPFFHYNLFVIVSWYINIWFWISLCLFYMQKTLKKEQIIWIISLSVFISVCLMLSYNKWTTVERIGFLNVGFLRGIAGMGIGYLLSIIPYKNSITHLTKQLSMKYISYTILEFLILGYTVGCMFIKNWYISPYYILLSSTGLVYLFLQKKGGLSQITNHPIFFNLGKFLLPIYLLQEAPLQLFNILLKKHKNFIMMFPYPSIIITSLFVILWGIISYYLIKTIIYLFNKQKQI